MYHNNLNVGTDVSIQVLLLRQILKEIWNECQTMPLNVF